MGKQQSLQMCLFSSSGVCHFIPWNIVLASPFQNLHNSSLANNEGAQIDAAGFWFATLTIPKFSTGHTGNPCSVKGDSQSLGFIF
jgi:hypothetical protein